MFHRIILVLTLFSAIGLVAVGCTGSDTTREIIKIKCPGSDELVEDVANCPPVAPTPPPPPTPPTPPTPPDDDRGGPTRSDCTPVQGVDLIASSQNDVICGNDRDNTISGLAGDDTIYGGPGNDTLIGGDDRDTLRGEAGDDILTGGQGDDILDGGEGTDTADYSHDSEVDMRTTGVDSVIVNLAEGQATDGHGDVDELISIEKVIGTSADDTITGSARADVIVGGAGEDTLNGGAGEDTLSYENEKTDADAGTTAVAVTIDLAANTTAGGSADMDVITEDSFENITGGDAGDTLRGDERANKLRGGGGADTLIGRLGRDTLTGGTGGDCFIADVREAAGAAAGDSEIITDFNKTEDAITVCGDITTPGVDAGEKLLKFSGTTIQRLTRASVAEDPDTTAIERVTPVYVNVATLSGSSTRLTATEIENLDADVFAIGRSDAATTCTCP